MARLDWAVLCERAFLDRHERLCVIGIVERLSVPRLPILLPQSTLVAHLADVQAVEELAVRVAIVTPNGKTSMPTSPGSFAIQVAHEYVLVTLRDLPLADEGIYRFRIALGEASIVSVDIPVVAAGHEDRLDGARRPAPCDTRAAGQSNHTPRGPR